MRKVFIITIGFVVSSWLTACGPSKQVLRLQRRIIRLQAEKEREVARLKKEKFEVLQVRRVAMERKQKECSAEVRFLRKQHRKLSFRVSKSTQKIQRLLNKIMSDTLLMPMHQEPLSKPNEIQPATVAPTTPTLSSGLPPKKQEKQVLPEKKKKDVVEVKKTTGKTAS